MTELDARARGTEVSLIVDGDRADMVTEVDETLLQMLRGRLGVTSARGTCGIGVCGTCTVLVDDRPVSSCLMLAAQAAGRAVTTAEGLRDESGALSAVQEAFIRRGAYQCSFCIPAMTLAVHAALADPDVGHDLESVREYLSGNLCRCGTYPQILEAVSDVLSGAEQADNTEEDR